MTKSLQDQLLKAGLVNKKQVTKANQQKRRQSKQQQKGQEVENEVALAAKSARAEKAAKDKALNQAQTEAANEKAILAQVKQMIDQSSISREEGDIGYSFKDGTLIKKLNVTADQQNRLSWGQIAIVKSGEDYFLVPKKVAEKIQQRLPEVVLLINQSSSESIEEDDPYADYQIPDDLMW